VDSVSNNGTITVNSNNSSSSTLIVNGAMSGTGALSVLSGGLLAFSANVGSESVNTLSMTGTAKLDLNNNRLFINYGSGTDPIASIEAWVKNGYFNTGGPAIISSAPLFVNGLQYGIGYADGADGVVAGLPSGEIEIMYTLLGDANLDGSVNGDDFTLMSDNFNDGVTDGWDKGDFDYSGSVNGNDFSLMSGNFNEGASAAAPGLANGISLTNVPEPGAVLLGGMVLAGALGRRRRASFR
jgi:hypothetical protein